MIESWAVLPPEGIYASVALAEREVEALMGVVK